MRICLISPGHLSTNPRLVKEAFALKTAGYDVHVVCGRYQPVGTANDEQIKLAIGQVTQVPFGPAESSRSTYLRQSLKRKAGQAVARFWSEALKVVEAAHHPVTSDLADATRKIRADLYIAHYVAALPAAARAARRHGAVFAFDAEDFHLGDLPDAPVHARDKKIIRAIEGRYLPHAAYVTAASPMIAEAYADAYKIPTPHVILNVFNRANAPASPTPRGTATPGPSLYWFSQTIGPGRGIETAIGAIAYAKSAPHLYLRGQSSKEYALELRDRAQRAGVAERLHFLRPISPSELERSGAGFDLGYVGEGTETCNRQIALTNKLFSYLSSGLTIVASDIPSHQRLAPEIGEAMMLFPVDDAIALAHTIDELLLHPQRLQASRAHSWGLGQSRFSWDCEQGNILKVVKKAVQ